MTKVEELLERLLCVDKTPLYCSQGECDYAKGKHIPTRTELEELIALARSEGAKKQQEQDAQYEKYEREAYEQAEKIALAKAHAEGVAAGAEQERERIRNLGTLHDKGNGFPFYSVVASVLAPTKEKP